VPSYPAGITVSNQALLTTPLTLASVVPGSGRTPSSRAGASCARSAAVRVGPPAWSRRFWFSSSLADAKWNEFTGPVRVEATPSDRGIDDRDT